MATFLGIITTVCLIGAVLERKDRMRAFGLCLFAILAGIFWLLRLA